MAGSYKHVVDDSGRLLSNDNFVGMIENLGDAYEAITEMYGMIWFLAYLWTGQPLLPHDSQLMTTISTGEMTIQELVEVARVEWNVGIEESPGVER